MRYSVPLLAVSCLLSTASAQRFEGQFYLPDSVGRIRDPGKLLYSPGNNLVFVGGGSEALLVLDGVTSRAVARVELSGAALAMCYDQDDNQVYVASRDAVEVVDAVALRRVAIIPVDYDLEQLCYNPAAAKIYGRAGHRIFAIDARADTVLSLFQVSNRLDDLCCNSAGTKLYCAAPDSEGVVIVDCLADTVIGYVWTGEGSFRLLYNGVSNRVYISETADDDIGIIDAGPDTLITYIWMTTQAEEMCLSLASNKIYASDMAASEIKVICGYGDSVTADVAVGPDPSLLAFDSQDNRIYCATRDTLTAIDCASDSVIARIPTGSAPAALGYNMRENRLYLVPSPGQSLSVLDCGANQVVEKKLVWFGPRALAFCPAGDKLYTAAPWGMLGVVDIEHRSLAKVLPMSARPLFLGVDPTASRVYCAGGGWHDSTLAIVDVAADSTVAVLRLGPLESDLAFNPNQSKAYCATSDSTVCAIDVLGDTVVARVGLSAPAHRLGFSTDDNKLYCSQSDEKVTIVDAGADTVLAELEPGSRPSGYAYVPTQGLMCCACPSAGVVVGIDGMTNRITHRIVVGGYPNHLVYNGVRDKLYCFNGAGAESTGILVVDCRTMEPVNSIVLPGAPGPAVFDSLADRLDIICGRSLVVVDGLQDSVIEVVDLPWDVAGFAWSGTGRRFYLSFEALSSIGIVCDTTAPGVAEGRGGPAGFTGPSIVRGVLRTGLRPTASRPQPDIGLYDANGRKVMELAPGLNDVRNLAPGVYFLKPSAAGSQPSAVRKVIVTS